MKHIIYIIFTVTILFTSCRKFVEVQSPPTRIDQGNVYNDDATATAVLTGLYTRMISVNVNSNGFPTITKFAGLSADEFGVWSGYGGTSGDRDLSYFRNSLYANAVSSPGAELWDVFYSLIHTCNAAVEGLNSSTKLTPSVKQQLLGEAKFLRAFFYFYLVNLYGDVPIATVTDFEINRMLARSSKTKVYELIVNDLQEAKNLLSGNFVDGKLKPYAANAERIRPTKWAALALLARVFLYNQDWANAESYSTLVLNQTALFDTVSLNQVFLRNSKEAIWQLQPVIVGSNTEDAKLFVLTAAPTGFSNNKPFYLSSSLINSFELNDNRKTNWVSTYTDGANTYSFPYKYKVALNGLPLTEYFMVFRLAEMYLIRAEARAQLSNTTGAKTDLNVIRTRAGLGNTLANSSAELVTAVLLERRVELFAELGHRWFDLKRTNTVDAVMSLATIAKGGAWQSSQKLYPISFTELDRAPNLIQNPGY